MSQKSEDLLQSFFIQCSDVGLNCDCVVFGKSEEKVNDAMIMHMDEYHAIIPKEMTTCMRLRIREIYTHIVIRCAQKYYVNSLMSLKNYCQSFESLMRAEFVF